MNRFFIQLSDMFPCIENTQNINSKLFIDKTTLKKILSKFDHNSLFFVVDEELYEYFKDFYTIGYYDKCDIVLINDSNIDNYSNRPLKNVYLFVDDESALYENFNKIYKNVEGFIEFKMLGAVYYDENILKNQIEKISNSVYDEELRESPLIVKQLNGFKFSTKFQEFGNGDFFIGANGVIYYHPNFYYQNSKYGILCSIDEFKDEEANIHFTEPHLICMNCECFYCDRDIYKNKILTGEYKVPCINSCRITTLFSRYSKILLNRLTKTALFDPEENLDIVDSFDSEQQYEKYLRNETKTNQVKEIKIYHKLWELDENTM